jgi:uncharacterized repeat protein (TIGR03843 family)
VSGPDSRLEPDDVCKILTRGTLEVTGRLLEASNASFLASVELDGVEMACLYMPVAGERPLWDFPTGTLAGREVAAYDLSRAVDLPVVPPTVLRDDGPYGGGMCQEWIDIDPEVELVELIRPDEDTAGRKPVVYAEDGLGQPVVLVHADDPQLRSIAVFDVIINNADRKGGHILVDHEGRVRGCDHGVSFHVDPKLRTILWGWSGEPLRDEDVDLLQRLRSVLKSDGRHPLDGLLEVAEVGATRARVRRLLSMCVMPSPAGRWRAIPWPVF